MFARDILCCIPCQSGSHRCLVRFCLCGPFLILRLRRWRTIFRDRAAKIALSKCHERSPVLVDMKKATGPRMATHPDHHPTSVPARWTAKEIKLLGTLPDTHLARKLRRPIWDVRNQRDRLNIPPFQKRPKFRFWKASEIRQLGTMLDPDLARRLNRTRSSVVSQRRRLGIPCCPFDQLWTKKEERLLGTQSDALLAVRFNRTVVAVKGRRNALRIHGPLTNKRRWTRSEDRHLGKAFDKEIARRLGRTTASVFWRRQVLGIRSFDGPVTKSGIPWTTSELKLLGKITDVELARRTQHSERAVLYRRKTLGIPRFPGKTKSIKPPRRFSTSKMN
jgi:hypothetical protein